MGKKVLVRSRFREPLVRTTREWERDEKGKLKEINGYRQFVNHHAYMTPSEAAFIIDSDENKMATDSGQPPVYYYPAGAPLIVDDQRDGALAPPLAQSGIVANNEQQATAARKALAQAETALAAKQLKTAADAKDIHARGNSTAQKIAKPAGLDEDDSVDMSRPLQRPGATGGGNVLNIENPDIPGNSELKEPVVIS